MGTDGACGLLFCAAKRSPSGSLFRPLKLAQRRVGYVTERVEEAADAEVVILVRALLHAVREQARSLRCIDTRGLFIFALFGFEKAKHELANNGAIGQRSSRSRSRGLRCRHRRCAWLGLAGRSRCGGGLALVLGRGSLARALARTLPSHPT